MFSVPDTLRQFPENHILNHNYVLIVHDFKPIDDWRPCNTWMRLFYFSCPCLSVSMNMRRKKNWKSNWLFSANCHCYEEFFSKWMYGIQPCASRYLAFVCIGIHSHKKKIWRNKNVCRPSTNLRWFGNQSKHNFVKRRADIWIFVGSFLRSHTNTFTIELRN